MHRIAVSGRSLVQAAELLAWHRSSAVELLDEALTLIDRTDGLVHAWTTLDRDRAREAAIASDQRAAHGARRSALDGVPIGIKDLIDTAGLRTTYGSPLFADHVPAEDAHVVARLRAAGVVVVGKTVTTEFATFDPPPTRNPWNLAHTPGGSSSGSVAAVAVGMLPAAIGSQTGGSTIRPASYCGVVGYMPSPGWVGRTGVYPCSWSLDRVGLFGTSVRDVSLLLDGCLGRDQADPISRAVRRRPRKPRRPRAVAVLSSLLAQATPSMRRAVESVGSLLANAGARIELITTEELELAHAAHLTIMRTEISSVHADLFAAHADAYGPHISALIETGRRVGAVDYVRGLRYRSRFRREHTERMGQFEVLLAPAAEGAAEASLDTIGSPVMNLLATFGGLPALGVPAALAESGLPLGVQLIGRPDRDDELLAIGCWLEDQLAFRRPALPTVRTATPSPG
jgi:Asp-tRNA(Asn)/Glu-tRNA(Gln) amidotransferase A subunit family amidase